MNYEDLNQKNSDINKEIEFMKNAEKNQFDDSFGFGALPAGCSAQGFDLGLGKFTIFWTSSGEVSNSREYSNWK